MMGSATWFKRAFVSAALLSIVSSSASAGPLLSAGAILSGTVQFSGPDDGTGKNLNGLIDFAVFAPNTFPGAWSGVGPGLYNATPNEYVYAYQIFNNPANDPNVPLYSQVANSAATPVSELTLTVINQADTIGQFLLPGGFPADLSQSNLDYVFSQSADWFFSTVLDPGDDSWGLAFSSPFQPIFLPATVYDDGTSASVYLPSPGSIPSPEPSTFVLIALGLACGAPSLVRRLGNRK